MLRGCVQGWEGEGKGIQVDSAVCRINKRCSEQRPAGAGITQAVGRLRFVDADRIALDYGIEDTVACTDAGFAWPARDPPEQTVCPAWRPGNTQAWRNAVALRHQRIRDSGVGWIDQADWRGGVDF